MIHRNRVFRITPVADAATLVEKLTGLVWTPCTAFRLRDLIFANDAFSPDGAQEYAVLRDGRQIESITVSWCTRAELEGAVARLLEGKDISEFGEVTLRTDHPAGPCGHCR